MSDESSYILISPAKDEANHIETTIVSVIRQTAKPAKWVIVDDGSVDRTVEIVETYAREHPWIRLVRTEGSKKREPGGGVVRAFTAGYETIASDPFDFIVKLDCDLDLPPDYFSAMLNRFRAARRLGIASGVYLEKNGEEWLPVRMPEYHAAGAAKMVRRACFLDIGGFIPRRGWDTIDEIKAQMAGWETQHFPELRFKHLRREGSAIGFLRTSFASGEGHYLMGGGALFFALKATHRLARGRPPVLGALWMAAGYVNAWLRRKPLLVSESEAKFYRRQLNGRIWAKLVGSN